MIPQQVLGNTGRTVSRAGLGGEGVLRTRGMAAQARVEEISGGRGRTHFAGAYWGWGFHEDGVVSGLRVARELGIDVP